MKHTLVIVGAGLAGLSAALTAVKNGWTVKLVSSLASERAQSVMAEGGINAALNTKGEEDSPEQHYTDTLTAACELADPNAVWGDDYSICCCVSATQTGKEMQFFGARANLAKCLLYAINGGVDEKSHEQCGPNYAPITSEYLNYDEVLPKYVQMLDWLAGLYVNVLNLIQYMHDKYYYEEAENEQG